MMFQGGSLWAGLVDGAMSQFQITRAWNKGMLSGKEYAVHTTENVTGAVGVMAGVEYGALLGTAVMPGIGTAVGAVAGALLGDKVGRAVGERTGKVIFTTQTSMTTSQSAG